MWPSREHGRTLRFVGDDHLAQLTVGQLRSPPEVREAMQARCQSIADGTPLRERPLFPKVNLPGARPTLGRSRVPCTPAPCGTPWTTPNGRHVAGGRVVCNDGSRRCCQHRRGSRSSTLPVACRPPKARIADGASRFGKDLTAIGPTRLLRARSNQNATAGYVLSRFSRHRAGLQGHSPRISAWCYSAAK